MARRAHVYPQVAATAADLVDGSVVGVPPALAARDAARLARRRNADVVAVGRGAYALGSSVRCPSCPAASARSPCGVGSRPARRWSW